VPPLIPTGAVQAKKQNLGAVQNIFLKKDYRPLIPTRRCAGKNKNEINATLALKKILGRVQKQKY
jgi:hypothetical protein